MTDYRAIRGAMDMRRHPAALTGLFLLLAARTACPDVSIAVSAAPRASSIVIYHDMDLALVSEELTVPLRSGENRVTISWADMPVTADSLRLEIHGASVSRRRSAPGAASVQWTVSCDHDGEYPARLSYLTKGLAFDACYVLTLNPDLSSGHLTAAATITNSAKRDFEAARLSLAIGDVRLGSQAVTTPAEAIPPAAVPEEPASLGGLPAVSASTPAVAAPASRTQEQFTYVVAGIHDLRSGDTLRVVLAEDDVSLESTYVYDPATYGNSVHRVLTLVNDAAHGLGSQPLMPGTVRLLWRTEEGDVIPLADAAISHVSIGSEAKLDAMAVPDVIVERKMMDYKIGDIEFDKTGRITGYETHKQLWLDLRNRTAEPVRIMVTERIPGVWSIETKQQYKAEGANAVVFTVELRPQEVRTLQLKVTRYQGSRAER